MGLTAGESSAMNDGGNHASQNSASASASTGRGSGRPVQPPIRIGAPLPANGIAPTRGCITICLVNSGAPLKSPGVERRSASGSPSSGIGSSFAPGARHGTEKAASASAITRPSCSMRAESVLSERPARSTVVRISTGPSSGEAA